MEKLNGFLPNVTKVINGTEMHLTETPILKEVRILKENLGFTLFKLQSSTEEICALTSVEDKKKCYELFNENKE